MDRDSRRARSVDRQRAEPEPSQPSQPSQPVTEPEGEASEPLSARGSKQGLQLRKLFKKFVAFGAHRAEGAKIGVFPWFIVFPWFEQMCFRGLLSIHPRSIRLCVSRVPDALICPFSDRLLSVIDSLFSGLLIV